MNAKQLFFIACVTTNIFFILQSSDDDITRKFERNKIILIEDNNTAEQQLEEIVQKNNKVVVDFFASECGPCKKFASIFENVAQQQTNVTFVKINVGKCPKIRGAYNISSLPTLVYFKNGYYVHQIAGQKTTKAFTKEIEQYLL